MIPRTIVPASDDTMSDIDSTIATLPSSASVSPVSISLNSDQQAAFLTDDYYIKLYKNLALGKEAEFQEALTKHLSSCATNDESKQRSDTFHKRFLVVNIQQCSVDFLRSYLQQYQITNSIVIELINEYMAIFPRLNYKKDILSYIKAKKNNSATENPAYIAEKKLEFLLLCVAKENTAETAKTIQELAENLKYISLTSQLKSYSLDEEFFRMALNLRDDNVISALSSLFRYKSRSIKQRLLITELLFVDTWPSFHVLSLLLENCSPPMDHVIKIYRTLIAKNNAHHLSSEEKASGSYAEYPTYFDKMYNHPHLGSTFKNFLAIDALFKSDSPEESKNKELQSTHLPKTDKLPSILKLTLINHDPKRFRIIHTVLQANMPTMVANLYSQFIQLKKSHQGVTLSKVDIELTHSEMEYLFTQMQCYIDARVSAKHPNSILFAINSWEDIPISSLYPKMKELAEVAIRSYDNRVRQALIQRGNHNSNSTRLGTNLSIVASISQMYKQYSSAFTEESAINKSKLNVILKDIHNYFKQAFYKAENDSPESQSYLALKGFYLVCHEQGRHVYASNITIQLALVIVWLGIMDNTINPTDVDRERQKKLLANQLRHIHEEYNKNNAISPSCIFEAIMEATVHPGIRIYRLHDFVTCLKDLAETIYRESHIDIRRALHQEQLLSTTSEKPVTDELTGKVKTQYYRKTESMVRHGFLTEKQLQEILDAFTIDCIRPVSLEIDLIQYYQRIFESLPPERQQDILLGGSTSSSGQVSALSPRFINEYKAAFIADLIKRNLLYPKVLIEERFQSAFFLEDFPVLLQRKQENKNAAGEPMEDVMSYSSRRPLQR